MKERADAWTRKRAHRSFRRDFGLQIHEFRPMVGASCGLPELMVGRVAACVSCRPECTPMDDFTASLPPEAPEKPFDRLCWIMERLLGPEGCPWDREQTHDSLKQYLIEEAY